MTTKEQKGRSANPRSAEQLPPDALVQRTGITGLNLPAVARLAVHLEQLTEAVQQYSEPVLELVRNQAAAEANKAAFWAAMISIPNAMLTLLKNKYAAVIIAFALSVGGLHLIGVEIADVATLVTAVVEAFRGQPVLLPSPTPVPGL